MGGFEQLYRTAFKPGFIDDFQLGSMIGSGSFGVVHVATHIKSGRQYAVKSIPKRFFGQHLEPHFVARIQHEVDVFRHMGQSLNVIHLIEAYEDDVCVDLVMELAAGGSLWSRINRGSYTEATAAKIIADILRAVAQCHAKGVILRDVKPENFLFLSKRENSPLKMVDFGLAEYCKQGQVLTERAGTPFYIAPEVLRQSYSFPADVWSAGITAYQLLTGRFPWHADPDWLDACQSETGVETQFGSMASSNKQLWRAIMYGKFDFEWPPWDNISVGARDLVQAMLTRDPEQRPTAAELLRHPWLSAAVTSLDGSDSSSSISGPSTRPLDDSLVQRLQRYGTYGRLKQVALCQVAKVISADSGSLQGLAEAFAALDPQHTGKIPYEAMRDLLASGKYDLSEVEVRMLMSQFDLDHNGSVDCCEWLAALMDWTQAQGSSKWRDWIKQVFDAFDADGSGSISRSELLQLLDGAGASSELEGQEPYAIDDTVPAVLRQVDTDGDGRLSFEEFAALLQSDAGDKLELFPSRRRRRRQQEVLQRRLSK
eukprot:GHUV01018315.1.p1 GENE.GHUV01018315.1~~GHUV01018315.1.p1  ORF type:complete len:541 (+),score=186.60 GHUV01018315.1:610-2232(+)